MHLGSIYFITKQFEESIAFYSKLLHSKPSLRNENRWVQFDFEGHCIALYNQEYDLEKIRQEEELSDHYNEEYLKWIKTTPITHGNSTVLNFWVEDLKVEHQRVKGLGIGEVSRIKYVNIAMPYWFFTLEDPDGNVIEITGTYDETSH